MARPRGRTEGSRADTTDSEQTRRQKLDHFCRALECVAYLKASKLVGQALGHASPCTLSGARSRHGIRTVRAARARFVSVVVRG